MGNSVFGVKFIHPQDVIDQLEIKDGMKVADFGCGAGHFSFAAARKIGEEGTVYSLDVLSEKLGAVESRAKSLGLSNIITKRVDLEKEGGSRLENDSMDWVIMKDILFQNKDKKQILAEAGRVVKKGGKILAIEWKCEDASIGPEKQLRIAKEALIGIAQQNNLGVIKEIEVGNFHYGLVLEK